MRLQVKKIPYCAGNRGCGIGFKAQRKGGLNLARQVLAGGVSLLSLAGGTFTRATSAWDPIAQAIAPPGVMRTLTQSLVPTLQDILALIEGARTNLFAAGSGEFQAGWSSTRSSLVAGSWTDPSGGSGVMLAEDSTASNTHMCFQAVNITNALPYTCTVYAKAGLRSVIVLQFGSTAFTTPTAWFDLSAGAVSKTSGSPTATSITAVPGNPGVYRCTMTATSNATASDSIFCYLDVSPTGSAVYSGLGSTYGAYVWGAQLEQAAFPSSYISNRNLTTFSQTFTNAAWLKTNCSATAAAATSPISGLMDASLITETALTADLELSGIMVASGAALTDSIYVKPGNVTWLYVTNTNGALNNGAYAYFNISTGAVGNTGVVGTGTLQGAAIKSAGNGWYRISLSATPGAFAANAFNVHSATANGNPVSINGSTYYVDHYQIEYGSTATAYWGTDATVGGRDADNRTCTYAMGTGNGTLLALVVPYGWSSTTGAYACDDSTTTGVASAYVNGANHAHGKRKDSVASQDVGGSTLTPTSGTLMQIAVTWDAAHVTCYTNAVAGTPVATTPPYVASSGLQIGAAQGNITPFYGWVGIRAFPTALTQPQLAAINLALSGRI